MVVAGQWCYVRPILQVRCCFRLHPSKEGMVVCWCLKEARHSMMIQEEAPMFSMSSDGHAHCRRLEKVKVHPRQLYWDLRLRLGGSHFSKKKMDTYWHCWRNPHGRRRWKNDAQRCFCDDCRNFVQLQMRLHVSHDHHNMDPRRRRCRRRRHHDGCHAEAA